MQNRKILCLGVNLLEADMATLNEVPLKRLYFVWDNSPKGEPDNIILHNPVGLNDGSRHGDVRTWRNWAEARLVEVVL